MRRRSLILLSALLVFFSAGFAVWLVGGHLTRPAASSIGAVPDNASLWTVESESGSELAGWLFPARNASAVAILMHGVRSNRTQMVDRAVHLQSMGISSLVFDFQAHGESAGNRITLGHLESQDAQAAVGDMISRYPKLPVMVIGVSMGGAASVLAKPALDVDVLILESVYPDIVSAIGNRMELRMSGGRILSPLLSLQVKPRAGVWASELSPVIEAERVQAATLVLSGDQDRQTTKDDTLRLFESLPEPKQLAFIDGAAHVDLERFDPERYWSVVEPFMARHRSHTRSRNAASVE